MSITVNVQAAEVGRQEQRMHVLVASPNPPVSLTVKKTPTRPVHIPDKLAARYQGHSEENGWLHNYDCNYCHGIVIFTTI